MTWLIMTMAVMMVISPVMWLKPSPHQRRQGGLRALAREKGMEISVDEVPLHMVKEKLPAYRLRYPGDRPGPDFVLVRDAFASAALERYADGWRFRVAPLRPLPEPGQARLAALIALLPDDALMLRSTPAGLTLWWSESGTADSLAPCLEAAVALRDALGGHADRPGNGPLRGPGVAARQASSRR